MSKEAESDKGAAVAIAGEILGNCVAGRTLQIARIVSARYDAALARHGLTAHQLTLISMIAKMQPVVARDMLPYLKMEQSTLSRNLDRMVGKGWIKVVADGADNRTRQVSLSHEGLRILAAAYDDWNSAQAKLLSDIGKDGVESLRGVANAINPLLPR